MPQQEQPRLAVLKAPCVACHAGLTGAGLAGQGLCVPLDGLVATHESCEASGFRLQAKPYRTQRPDIASHGPSSCEAGPYEASEFYPSETLALQETNPIEEVGVSPTEQ